MDAFARLGKVSGRSSSGAAPTPTASRTTCTVVIVNPKPALGQNTGADGPCLAYHEGGSYFSTADGKIKHAEQAAPMTGPFMWRGMPDCLKTLGTQSVVSGFSRPDRGIPIARASSPKLGQRQLHAWHNNGSRHRGKCDDGRRCGTRRR